MIKYFITILKLINTNTALGAGISFIDAGYRIQRAVASASYIKYSSEKNIKRVERDAFEWFLHNLQNLK